jgi:hypothetical protein
MIAGGVNQAQNVIIVEIKKNNMLRKIARVIANCAILLIKRFNDMREHTHTGAARLLQFQFSSNALLNGDSSSILT